MRIDLTTHDDDDDDDIICKKGTNMLVTLACTLLGGFPATNSDRVRQ